MQWCPCAQLLVLALVCFLATRAVVHRALSPRGAQGTPAGPGRVPLTGVLSNSSSASEAHAIQAPPGDSSGSGTFSFEEGSPLPPFNLPQCMEEPAVAPAEEFMTSDMYMAGRPTRHAPPRPPPLLQ